MSDDLMTKTIHAFRLGQEAYGSELLTQLIDQSMHPNNVKIVDNETYLLALQTLLQAQMRGDYLWLADILQYELQDNPACLTIKSS